MTADGTVSFPSVPRDRLDRRGWVLEDESVDGPFRLSGHAVARATRRFVDGATREAVRERVGVEYPWRRFDAAALALEPPLPPAADRSFLLPTIRAKTVDRFRTELQQRGFVDVRRSRTERIAVESGNRIPLARFRAVFETDTPNVAVPVVAWVGVWDGDGFRVGGGAYPTRPLGDLFAIEAPQPILAREPEDCRRELFELIGAIA